MPQTDSNLINTVSASSKLQNRVKYKKGDFSSLPRLYIQAKNNPASMYEVEIKNAGSIPAYNCCCDIYVEPLHPLYPGSSIPLPANELNFIKSLKFSVGADETIGLNLRNSIPPSATPKNYFAFLYDPILDPFPIDKILQYKWSEQNILINSYNPVAGNHISNWEEYVSDQPDFSNAQHKTGNNRTWKGKAHPDNTHVPHYPWIDRSYFFPGTTSKDYAELRQTIAINQLVNAGTIQYEINKRNVSFRASCLLKTYAPQNDAGNLRMELFQDQHLLNKSESGFTHPDEWTTKSTAEISDYQNVTSVIIKLRAQRRSGEHNDANFDNINLFLKHRQIARIDPLVY